MVETNQRVVDCQKFIRSAKCRVRPFNLDVAHGASDGNDRAALPYGGVGDVYAVARPRIAYLRLHGANCTTGSASQRGLLIIGQMLRIRILNLSGTRGHRYDVGPSRRLRAADLARKNVTDERLRLL